MNMKLEESRADQDKMLAAVVAAINSHGDLRTVALARRAKLDEKRATNAMRQLSDRGLVHNPVRDGNWVMTERGWQEAGVKPPLWVMA